MKCEECGKEITKESYNDNNGLCYQCYKKELKEEKNVDIEETCPAVTIVRVIATIEIIICAIMCLMKEFIFIQGIVLGILLYAFGEVIRLLFDIKLLLKNKKDGKES